MAQYEDFTIDQGTDVAIEIHVVDALNATKNLTNYSVSAKMKRLTTVIVQTQLILRQLFLHHLLMELLLYHLPIPKQII